MISENIKALRKAKGLTQEAFAERIGVSRGMVANLEYDKLQEPEKKLPLLKRISTEFDVPLEWILNGGELVLPDQTEAQKEAQRMAELIKSKDPAVKSFLEFWSILSKSERETLSRQIIEYARLLEENLKTE